MAKSPDSPTFSNMTPKEKAIELVTKYGELSIFCTPIFNDVLIPEIREHTRQCALIAVDEILDVIVMIYDYDFEKLNPYWEEVKKEIEKL